MYRHRSFSPANLVFVLQYSNNLQLNTTNFIVIFYQTHWIVPHLIRGICRIELAAALARLKRRVLTFFMVYKVNQICGSSTYLWMSKPTNCNAGSVDKKVNVHSVLSIHNEGWDNEKSKKCMCYIHIL